MNAFLDAWITAWVLFAGAAVGSFLNVVIARVPEGLSVVRPRSRCPRCQAPIAWYDNLPVLSWLLLRARCRGCGAPISARYPLVELLGAGVAWLALRRHGLSGAGAAELAFAATMLALAFIDLDTWLLPNELTWPLLVGSLVLAALGLAPAGGVVSSLSGAAAGFLAFAAVSVVGARVFGREALGFGDVWLLAGIGAWLGLAALLPVVLLASLQGTVVGLVLAVMGKLPKGEEAGEPATSTEAPTPTPTSTPTSTVEHPGAGGEPPLPLPRGSGGEGQGEGGESAGSARSAEGAEGAAGGETGEEEDDWVPPRNAVPFGPFLVVGALEWLYLGGEIVRLLPSLRVFR